MIGDSRGAARYAGLNIRRKTIQTFFLSGALAGLAGAVLVSGPLGLFEPRGPTIGLGFSGILVAAMARFNLLAVLPTAVFVAGVTVPAPSCNPSVCRHPQWSWCRARSCCSSPLVSSSPPIGSSGSHVTASRSTKRRWRCERLDRRHAHRLRHPLRDAPLAAIGEILAERSGVLNTIEGMMLVGPDTAFWTSVQTGSVWLAILVAISGCRMSAVVALMSITRVSQIVTGLGVVLFGIGLSSYIGRSGDPPLHGQATSATITPFLDSGPTDWPVVGPILLGHDFVVYLTWIFAKLASWYLFKTRTGLATPPSVRTRPAPMRPV